MTPSPDRRPAPRAALVLLLAAAALSACESPAPRRTSTVRSAPMPSPQAPSRTASAAPIAKPPAAPVAARPVAKPAAAVTAGGKPAATGAPAATAAVPAPAAVASDPDSRFKSALDLMKARQFTDAQAAFLALSRDFPTFSGPLTNLGILYAQGRQRDAAVASFSRAVDANPRNAVALNWLGILYRENGDYPRAVNAYQRALTARPDYAPAVLNLGILYDVFLHRPGDALAAYRNYQKLTGYESLIVAAWIRDLESPATAAPTVTAELSP